MCNWWDSKSFIIEFDQKACFEYAKTFDTMMIVVVLPSYDALLNVRLHLARSCLSS